MKVVDVGAERRRKLTCSRPAAPRPEWQVIKQRGSSQYCNECARSAINMRHTSCVNKRLVKCAARTLSLHLSRSRRSSPSIKLPLNSDWQWELKCSTRVALLILHFWFGLWSVKYATAWHLSGADCLDTGYPFLLFIQSDLHRYWSSCIIWPLWHSQFNKTKHILSLLAGENCYLIEIIK